MARKKSLFDDPVVEIEAMTDVINQDIKRLRENIASLENLPKSSSKYVDHHAGTVVDTLKTKLRQASKQFTNILQIRTKVKKYEVLQSITYLYRIYKNNKRNVKFMHQQDHSFPNLIPQWSSQCPNSKFNDNLIILNRNLRYDDGSVRVEIPERSHSQLQAQLRPSFQRDPYLYSRGVAIENIQKVVAELQQMFMQINTLVAEQQESIER